MKRTLLATAIFVATALPSFALTNSDVLAAMNVRIVEISQQMTAIEARLAGGVSPALEQALTRELRILNVRQGQLKSLTRVVPQYNERFLLRLVTQFDLDVSLA